MAEIIKNREELLLRHIFRKKGSAKNSQIDPKFLMIIKTFGDLRTEESLYRDLGEELYTTNQSFNLDRIEDDNYSLLYIELEIKASILLPIMLRIFH
jgi:hypothetical protein